MLCLYAGMILCGCKGHASLVKETTATEHETIQKGVEYWEEVEDTLYLLPVAPFRGDSMTIPPSPPAPSFHYVWLSPSSVPSSIVPVAVRHSVKRGAQVDSTQASRMVEIKETAPQTRVFTKEIRFWKWCSIAFFFILCCITCFFICIYRKK